jgi:predicted permease
MTVAFALVGAYRPGARLSDALGAGRSAAGARTGRVRAALVVVQVGLAVVLLSFAGLMLRSVQKLSRIEPGFAADHLITARLTLTGGRYDATPARVGFVSTLVDRLRRAPGVRSAGLVSVVPLGGMRSANVVEIDGRPGVPGAAAMIIDQRHVSPGYFDTMRIPLVRGRLLDAGDDGRSERVVLINHTMAARYFPDEDPLNRRIRLAGGFDSGRWLRIVGVVGDVRHLSLDRDPVPEVYHPIAQTAVPTFTLVVRTVADPSAMAPTVSAVVGAIDSDLPLYEVRTMDDRVAASFAQKHATMLLLIATAALAAALAAVAIYGSIWYSVVQRTPEIGIRVALGASRAMVFRDVVGAALRIGAIGAALGIVAAIASGRVLEAMLFQTRTSDPRTHAAVAAAVLLLAAGASLGPAFRAMRIDPLRALRAE